MADLTARFAADFSKFSDAVTSATVTLKSLETGSGKVEDSLNRMVDKFSGRKLIQDAELMVAAVERLGGASKLTEAELERVGRTAAEAAEKMTRLGMDVPDNMRALATETKAAGEHMTGLSAITAEIGPMILAAFSVQAIINFATEALNATAAIKKISDQTGMTTAQVQKLQYAASQTSVEFGVVVSASQGLEAALGDPGGNKGVIGALRGLGIDMDAFMGKDAAGHILEISEKLKGLTSQTEYAAAARAIFGNKFKEMTPMLLADMEAIGAGATVTKDKSVQAVDQMWAQWASFKQNFQSVVATQLFGYDEMGKGITDWVEKNSLLINGIKTLQGAYGELTGASSGLEGALKKAQTDLPAVGGAAKKAGVDLLEMAEAEKELDKELEASFKARAKKEAEELAAAIKKAAEETAAWVKNFQEVEEVATDWRATLASLDPALVRHITQLLDAGVAVEKVAKAFGLNVEVLKAYKNDLKLADEATAESARLSTQLATLVIQNTGTALEASVAAINRDAELYHQSLVKKGIWDAEFAAKNDALRKARIERESVDWKVINDASGGSLEDMATKAEATYAYMLAHSEKFKTSAVQDQRNVAEAARLAADSWEQSFMTAAERVITVGHSAAEEQAQAAQSVALSWSQAMSAVAASQGTMSGSTNAFTGTREQVQRAFDEHRYFGPVAPGGFGGVHPDWQALGFTPTGSGSDMPGRAAGGPVSAGKPYLVGEQGPELYVPSQSGTVLPNGVGGGSIVNNFYVNGTGADVARVVNQELTRIMRVGRKWPAV